MANRLAAVQLVARRNTYQHAGVYNQITHIHMLILFYRHMNIYSHLFPFLGTQTNKYIFSFPQIHTYIHNTHYAHVYIHIYLHYHVLTLSFYVHTNT
uniref:Uncharacterized protein n=1 Tax=Octopus bimaculoides TaxID=37653 RepID=A0A0L8HJ06_OCTBM